MFNPETYLLAVPKGSRPWIQLVCNTHPDSLRGPHPPYLGHFLGQCSLFPESSISLLGSCPSLPALTESSLSLHPPPPPPEHHTQATVGSRFLPKVTERGLVLAQLSVFRSPGTGDFSTCLQLQPPGFSPPFSAPPILFPVCFLGP